MKQSSFYFVKDQKLWLMRFLYTLILPILFIPPLLGQTPELFQLQYEGETAFATQQVDTRYLGEYLQNKGLASQQFLIKISAKESYLLTDITQVKN